MAISFKSSFERVQADFESAFRDFSFLRASVASVFADADAGGLQRLPTTEVRLEQLNVWRLLPEVASLQSLSALETLVKTAFSDADAVTRGIALAGLCEVWDRASDEAPELVSRHDVIALVEPMLAVSDHPLHREATVIWLDLLVSARIVAEAVVHD